MIGISAEKVLAHSKEAFTSKLKACSPNIEDIDVAIGKTRATVLLFKSQQPQPTSFLC